MHILVVDDSSTMRRILMKTLARLGFPRSSEASDGRAALAHLNASPVDLVIVDWHMPGMSGLELVRMIRSSPATRDVPVLMVTANAAPDDVVQAVRAGITGYVVKPFTGETLKQQVAAALRPPSPAAQPGQTR
jgi:two-component system chemotaxis response regulator CheY